jgi:hypothetical protein
MAKSYKTPGVYIEEIKSLPASIAQVETAIPAFIGYTEKATDQETGDLKGIPKRIRSLLEFNQYFGAAKPETSITVDVDNTQGTINNNPTIKVSQPNSREPFLMHYGLHMFYANGGGPCYIVSVGRYGENLDAQDAQVTSIINADDFLFGLNEIKKIDEPTLLVFPDATALHSDNDFYALYTIALQQCNDLKDRFTIIDTRSYDAANTVDSNIDSLRTILTSDTNLLKYGAAYYPFLETILDYVYDETQTEVTILTEDETGMISSNSITLDAIENSDIALYNSIKVEISQLPVILPPSATIAGIYARTDRDRGVWKAPANVSLSYVIRPTVAISDEDQKDLNVDVIAGKSINAIRSFTGKGNLVWGARTLAGNDNEWRYIPVRRLFNMVEESIKKGTMHAVFEPNDANTWVKVKAMIENYLIKLWRDGALAGARPEHAFYVKLGLGETMTAQDILDGNMIIEVGMAPLRPAEFIILRISHKMQET